MNNHMKGQSLIELLIAMAVFVLTASAITFLVLDSYVAHRAGREVTLATLLAEEGLEAARSIRDGDWDDLADGNHGVTTSADSWIFQGAGDDISNQLSSGERKVIVTTLDADRKEIKSQVTWEFSETRSQEVILVTYLTNWQREIPSEGCWGTGGFCDDLCQHSDYGSLTDYHTDPGCSDSCTVLGSFYLNPSGVCSNDGTGSCYKMGPTSTQDVTCTEGADCETGCGGTCTLCDQFFDPTSCTAQLDCFWQGKKCRGDCLSCDIFTDPDSCQAQSGCSWQAIKWYWNVSDPQEGHDSYITCEWYTP